MLTTTFHFVSPPRQNRLLAITHVNVLPMDNVPPLNFWPNPLEAYQQRLALIDYDAIRRLAKHMSKEQIWNCPTMTVYQPRANTKSLSPGKGLYPDARVRADHFINQLLRTEDA